MLTCEEAVELIESSPIESGNSGGKFALIKEGWGLKWWECEQSRDESYDLQELAADLSVGPQVGDKIDFRLEGYRCYGYFTEAVEILGITFQEEAGLDSDRSDWGDDEWTLYYDEQERVHDSQHYKEVKQTLKEEVGFYFGDDHLWNIGRRPDGSLVCIDFG